LNMTRWPTLGQRKQLLTLTTRSTTWLESNILLCADAYSYTDGNINAYSHAHSISDSKSHSNGYGDRKSDSNGYGFTDAINRWYCYCYRYSSGNFDSNSDRNSHGNGYGDSNGYRDSDADVETYTGSTASPNSGAAPVTFVDKKKSVSMAIDSESFRELRSIAATSQF
jgi:hypothetical protein